MQRFDSYDYVDKPVFNVLSDAQENDKRISCTVDYDFETGILTFKGNGEQESEYYDLNFLESAIERAERGGVGEAQRHDSFNADIKWYINQSQSRRLFEELNERQNHRQIGVYNGGRKVSRRKRVCRRRDHTPFTAAGNADCKAIFWGFVILKKCVS